MKNIRRLRVGEGLLFKEVRLKSLKDSPEAFLSKYEDALKRSEDSWSTQSDASASGSSRATFIVDEGTPLGIGAIYRDSELSKEAELLQMWISPILRGSGVVKELLNALFAWAEVNGISEVRAEVNQSNAQALKCYKKFGFKVSSDYDLESTFVLIKHIS